MDKKFSALGDSPLTSTRGSASGPRWGIRPDPRLGSRSTRSPLVCPLANPASAAVRSDCGVRNPPPGPKIQRNPVSRRYLSLNLFSVKIHGEWPLQFAIFREANFRYSNLHRISAPLRFMGRLGFRVGVSASMSYCRLQLSVLIQNQFNSVVGANNTEVHLH